MIFKRQGKNISISSLLNLCSSFSPLVSSLVLKTLLWDLCSPDLKRATHTICICRSVHVPMLSYKTPSWFFCSWILLLPLSSSSLNNSENRNQTPGQAPSPVCPCPALSLWVSWLCSDLTLDLLLPCLDYWYALLNREPFPSFPHSVCPYIFSNSLPVHIRFLPVTQRALFLTIKIFYLSVCTASKFSSTFSRILQAVCTTHSFTGTTSQDIMWLNPIVVTFNGIGCSLSNPPSSLSFDSRTPHSWVFLFLLSLTFLLEN